MTTTNSGYFGGCTGFTYAYGFGTTASLPGGTGSIYPSEFGVFNFDDNSGPTGWTSSVSYNRYQITNVGLNDTFETWRNRTNSDLIGKLNKMRVYGATGSDGIYIGVSTGGTLAVAFSGNVLRTNTTFCNNVNIDGTLVVGGITFAQGGQSGPTGSYTGGYNFDEKILVLNNDDLQPGCSYSGLILGGGVTGPDILNNTQDKDNAFVFDRPYLLHKDGQWRTKEGLWLEGRLDHRCVFAQGTTCGSTGALYSGPYGVTLCGGGTVDPDTGVQRIYFGPTLESYNYLDIDGRGGRPGSTGYTWHPSGTTNEPIGGVTSGIEFSNNAGPLLEFSTANNDGSGYGLTNIYRGANKKRVKKTNHGFSLGIALRYSSSGYTYASAEGAAHPDGVAASEVLGLVSKVVDKDTFDICYLGDIHATASQWNEVAIDSVSGGLSAGCVYFLSPSSAGADRGKLTNSRPNVVGEVLKPVLWATGLTTGVVLPYSGVVLGRTGCSGSTGGDSDINTLVMEQSYVPAQQTFATGDVLCISPTSASGFEKADYSKGGAFAQPVGVVTSVNSGGSKFDLTVSGNHTFPSAVVSQAGTYYLGTNGGLLLDPPSPAIKILDARTTTSVFINIQNGVLNNNQTTSNLGTYRRRGSDEAVPGQALSIVSATGATGYTYDNATQVNKNHVINGDFGIWQRGIGLTGISGHTGTKQTFFADRWARVCQTGTTGSRTYAFELKRGNFSKKQQDVEGYPDHYAIIKGDITYGGGTHTNEFYKVEQRFEDVTSFAGNIMTCSFYAKGSVAGTCHLAWIQNYDGKTGAPAGHTLGTPNYPYGVTANEKWTSISNIALGTTWSRYAYSFFVPDVSSAAGASGTNFAINSGSTQDHFASLSFFTQLTSLPDGEAKNIDYAGQLSLANVKLERGNISTPFNRVERRTSEVSEILPNLI